ncbi:MAG: GumC family protein [Candidatus Acidiferrales bacterium]
MKDLKKSKHTDDPAEQLRGYWQAIRMRWSWLLFITLIGTVIASLIIARLPNVYEATTTILVDPQQISDQYVNPPIKDTLTDRLQTISQEVLSSTRLQKIIDHYHLYPELQGAMSREQTIEYMRQAITIEVKHAAGTGPGSFTITYQGHDPVVVAQVANELAGQFIDWNVQSSEQVAETTTEFLGEQLGTAKQGLEQQEQMVRDFKMQHLGQMPEDVAANLGTLAQLRATYQANNDALNRLEQERIELTRLPFSPNGMGQNSTALSGLDERSRLEIEKAQLQEKLADLRQHYTPTFPDVLETTARLQTIREELKALPPSGSSATVANESPAQVRLDIISREMKRLGDENKTITNQIGAYQAKVDAVPLREQQITDLMRDYQISKDQYSSLLSKKYSADMANDLQRKQKGERFMVLDAARAPELPVKPQRGLLVLFSFVGAFLFSVVVVIGRDKLDRNLKAEWQLEDILPSSVILLAEIPTIQTPGDRRRQFRFAIFALAASLIACVFVAGVLWRARTSL